MRKFLLALLALALAAGAALFALAPVDPVAWEPAPNPGLEGDFTPNTLLADARRLLEGVGIGPEAVACGPGGEFFTGLADGRILAFDAGGNYRVLADTGGRPLGMKLGKDGHLVVADAIRGLLSVSPAGEVAVLADSVNGQRMLLVDDLDIAADGTIWFSDASTRRDYEHALLDFMEGRPNGRLLSHDPRSGETRVRIDGLFFANGVALGPADRYVLVNETASGRIHRLWLAGDRAGQRDLFHPGLPGTPDNITFDGRDTFWVAMPALRQGIDSLASLPLLRRALSLLPVELIGAGAGGYSFVVGLGLDGAVRANLQDINLNYSHITSAIECGDALYLGSMKMHAVARYPLTPPE